MKPILKDRQYLKFCLYGFFKNLRFFDAFIILFFREQGLSFLQIGLLFSVREISTNIFEIPTGIIADAYGRRLAMILAFVAYIFSFVIFYFFPHFAVYAVAMVFFAVGEAFRSGTHKAMILEYLKIKDQLETKVSYYGHTRASSQRGSAISSLIAAALVLYTGSYRVVFLASVVPYVFLLVLLLSYPKELDGKRGSPESGRVLKNAWLQIRATLMEFVKIFRNPGFLRILFNSASFDAGFKTVKDYIQPVLEAFTLSIPVFVAWSTGRRVAVLVGIVYFLLYGLTSMASKRAGILEEKVRSLTRAVNMTFLAGCLLIAATGGLLFLASPLPSIIVFVLVYVLMNVRRPITLGYVSEQIDSHVMASGLSSESQLKTLLVAFLAPLMGLVADAWGVGTALLSVGLLLLASYPLSRARSRA